MAQYNIAQIRNMRCEACSSIIHKLRKSIVNYDRSATILYILLEIGHVNIDCDC